MSPKEAKLFIETLANEVDLETVEVFLGHRVINQPQNIRALFVVSMALDFLLKNEKRIVTLPENTGKPWSEIEENELLIAFDGGYPVNEIATIHARSNGAIKSRLACLGCI